VTDGVSADRASGEGRVAQGQVGGQGQVGQVGEVSQGQTSARRPPSRRARVIGTVLAVLVTALIVAYPLAVALFFALIEWTGCFLECRTPDPHPLGAAVALLAALFLLGLPVLVGVLSWRGSSRKLLLAFAGLALVTAALLMLGLVL
jgi:hypothetical protein